MKCDPGDFRDEGQGQNPQEGGWGGFPEEVKLDSVISVIEVYQGQ